MILLCVPGNTKTASSGGFLTAGNTTLVIGVEDDQVDGVLHIIRTHCSRRVEAVPGMLHSGVSTHVFPTEVVVGGATVFVTPIERFEKM